MPVKQTSFLDTLKESCAANKICSALNISSDMLLYMIMLAGTGCLCGVLFKRCARLLLTATALAVALIAVLLHEGILSLNLVQLKMLAGVPHVDSLTAALNVWVQWIHTHMQEATSAAVGFLIGYFLG